MDKESLKELLELMDLKSEFSTIRERVDTLKESNKELYDYTHEFVHIFKDKLANVQGSINILLERQSRTIFKNPVIVSAIGGVVLFSVVEMIKHFLKITVN
jgi:predicted nuclease with TOPRIM domain